MTEQTLFWIVAAVVALVLVVLWTLTIMFYLLTRETDEEEPSGRMFLSITASTLFDIAILTVWYQTI